MPDELRARDIADIVETWQAKRVPLAAAFTRDGLAEFAATGTALSKQLIAAMDRRDPEFWSAWIELGQQASTIVVNARTIVNGVDRSSDYR
jgi:hypothetical protein